MARRENAGARLKAEVESYGQAQHFLERYGRKSRAGDWKEAKIANNTYLVWAGPGTRIEAVLHQTPIVTFWSDDHIVLNSGGYHTVTTKARMNAFLPYPLGVYQHKHEWYVTLSPHGDVTQSDVEFEDGMSLRRHTDGKWYATIGSTWLSDQPPRDVYPLGSGDWPRGASDPEVREAIRGEQERAYERSLREIGNPMGQYKDFADCVRRAPRRVRDRRAYCGAVKARTEGRRNVSPEAMSDLWRRERGPGKFESEPYATRFFYEKVLEGWDDASVDDGAGNSAALFVNMETALPTEYWEHHDDVPYEAVIIREDSQGFVYGHYFDTNDEAREAFAEYEEEWRGEEEDE